MYERYLNDLLVSKKRHPFKKITTLWNKQNMSPKKVTHILLTYMNFIKILLFYFNFYNKYLVLFKEEKDFLILIKELKKLNNIILIIYPFCLETKYRH